MRLQLSDTQKSLVRMSLARTFVGQSESTRLLAVLANQQVVDLFDADSVAALRSFLRGVVASTELQELVVANRKWLELVAAARSYRQQMSDEGMRLVAVVECAAALLFGVVAERSDSLGAWQGARGLSESRARMIVAAAGLVILREMWSEGSGNAVISESKLAAELGTHRDAVHAALKTGVSAGVLRVVNQHRSRAKRYALCSLNGHDYYEALRVHGDVVSAIVVAIAGKLPPLAEVIGKNSLQIEGKRWRERMERKAAQFPANKLVPRGSMRAVEPARAADVAAGLVLSASSPAWSGANGERFLNATLWLGMLRNVMGLTASKHVTSNTVMNALGDDIFNRLNAEEDITGIVALRLSWEGAAKLEVRQERWKAQSEQRVTDLAEWSASKDHAENALTRLITVAGGIPRWDESEVDERRAAIEALRAVVEGSGIPGAAQVFIGKRLERRLVVNRGWEKSAAAIGARAVFPSMPKPKVRVTGLVEPKADASKGEMIIGGVIV